MRASCRLKVLLTTFVAIVVGLYAIVTINVSGIYSTNMTDADMIRQRCPIRLVQPEWVSNQPDILTNWMGAEAKARIGLVIVLWAGSLSVIVWRNSRKRKHLTLT